MLYKAHLNDRPFAAIKAGIKTVEGRALTKWANVPWDKLQKDDIIVFFTSLGEELKVRVNFLHHYSNVKEMLEAEGVDNVLSNEPKTIEAGIKSYNSFTGYEEAIKKNGIYAIGIKLI